MCNFGNFYYGTVLLFKSSAIKENTILYHPPTNSSFRNKIIYKRICCWGMSVKVSYRDHFCLPIQNFQEELLSHQILSNFCIKTIKKYTGYEMSFWSFQDLVQVSCLKRHSYSDREQPYPITIWGFLINHNFLQTRVTSEKMKSTQVWSELEAIFGPSRF